MPLEFTAAPAAPTPPFTITGTPYYIAMFNAAGDNVGDTNIKRNVGSGYDTIEFKSPDRTNTPWGFNCADALNDSTFSGQLTYGTILMDAGSAKFGTRLKLDSGTSGYVALETSLATQVPIIDLFDYQHTKHAYIKNDDGLIFNVPDDDTIKFEQASTADNVSIVFHTDYASITTSNTSGAHARVRSNGTTSRIDAYDSTEDNYLDIVVEAGATNTYINLYNDGVAIFVANSNGISTDDTNFIKFLAASATAPTPDSKIEVIVNGHTYLIAAELVP